MNKTWLFSASLLFSLFSSSTYSAQPFLPKCPSVSAIKAANFRIEKDGVHYEAFQDDQKYDTDQLWNFAIFYITASSTDEASLKAKAALTTLSFSRGPETFMAVGSWRCTYNIGFGYEAYAYNPPL